MKNLLIACSCILLAAAESFAGTNNVPATSKVDLVELSKRIERIERILELGPIPTYSEYTNAVHRILSEPEKRVFRGSEKPDAYRAARIKILNVIRDAGVIKKSFTPPTPDPICRDSSGAPIINLTRGRAVASLTKVDDNVISNAVPILSDR